MTADPLFRSDAQRAEPNSPARSVIAADLLCHSDALARALVTPELFTGSAEYDGPWLRERYLEIVPVILPDALNSIVTGERLSTAALERVGASAAGLRQADIPFTAAVRGGVPALRAFAAFVQTLDLQLSFGDTVLLMGRAALIAQELGACWVEVWRASAPRSLDDGSTFEVDPDGRTADLDPSGSELEMIALTAAGHSTEEIATATRYSSHAVKWHLSRVMRAWKVGNRPAMIASAFVRGVLVARRRPPRPPHRQVPPAVDPPIAGEPAHDGSTDLGDH